MPDVQRLLCFADEIIHKFKVYSIRSGYHLCCCDLLLTWPPAAAAFRTDHQVLLQLRMCSDNPKTTVTMLLDDDFLAVMCVAFL